MCFFQNVSDVSSGKEITRQLVPTRTHSWQYAMLFLWCDFCLWILWQKPWKRTNWHDSLVLQRSSAMKQLGFEVPSIYPSFSALSFKNLSSVLGCACCCCCCCCHCCICPCLSWFHAEVIEISCGIKKMKSRFQPVFLAKRSHLSPLILLSFVGSWDIDSFNQLRQFPHFNPFFLHPIKTERWLGGDPRLSKRGRTTTELPKLC